MKKLLSALVLLVVINTPIVFAHPGGHGPIDETQAQLRALSVTNYLTEEDIGLGFGKLGESWNNLPGDAVRIHTRGEGYYIVSVTNTVEKKTLYILMTVSGDVYDANFSGKFSGLN